MYKEKSREGNKKMEKDLFDKLLFYVSGKKVEIYLSAAPNTPVIYLNTFGGEGDEVYRSIRNTGRYDFNLVVISDLAWSHDMSPWDIPPVFKNGTPCTGGADDYLKLLTGKIVPMAEEQINGHVLWRGLAGYSLAGLFAVYSLYRTDFFSRAASISGSLWFPGIKEYIFTHEMKMRPEHLYFSIGDKECKTSNPFLKVVQKNTEEIEEFYQSKGIDTVFRLNPGNHFKNAAERTGNGISWILER